MNEDTFDGKTNYCIHENTNESGICDNCLGKPNTQQSTVEERWVDRLNNSTITGHISGRHLIKIHSREDFNDENEYIYLDEWIKRVIKSELQLAEQKVREELKQTIIEKIEEYAKSQTDQHTKYAIMGCISLINEI